MTEIEDWGFPEELQPKASALSFDLDNCLASVVHLIAKIPVDAYTVPILGTERQGNGIVIRPNGLILTIGYLITEAETIWLTGNTGAVARGHVVGYDQASGLGLVQALDSLQLPALEFGSSNKLRLSDPVILASAGGRAHALQAEVSSKREFAGYWEYLLDEAIFTTPAHPSWGGAALLDQEGRLAGVGSLFVQEASQTGEKSEGNMVVPIDLLPPILDDLLSFGQVQRPPRPWLGMFAAQDEEGLVIAGLAKEAPAERAGVVVGDSVIEVCGEPVDDLATFFRKVWSLGAAGAEVPITLLRNHERISLRLHSADRNDFLKAPRLH